MVISAAVASVKLLNVEEPPLAVLVIVIDLLSASVTKVILLPATKLNVSVVVDAVTVDWPETATLLNAF
jgi:hypothetical protein